MNAQHNLSLKPVQYELDISSGLRSPPSSFGPMLNKNKPIQISKRVKKYITYDCQENNQDDIYDEIPNEDEVYIKESLLKKIEPLE